MYHRLDCPGARFITSCKRSSSSIRLQRLIRLSSATLCVLFLFSTVHLSSELSSLGATQSSEPGHTSFLSKFLMRLSALHNYFSSQVVDRRKTISLAAEPLQPVGCGVDSCSLERPDVGLLRGKPFSSSPSATRLSRKDRVRAYASPSSSTSTVDTKKWWEAHKHLWTEAHSAQEFEQIVKGSKEDVIFVDYYATWCKGCQKTYPSLCTLAAQPDLQGRVKFVKVCADEVRDLAKALGVKALPYVQVFRTGDMTPAIGWQAVPSRIKTFKPNLEVVLNNPGKSFELDPNGLVAVTTKNAEQLSVERTSKEAQLQALRQNSNKLFDHLMAVAQQPAEPAQPNGTKVNGAKAGIVAGAAADSSTATQNSLSDSDLVTDKNFFLRKYRREYGYGLKIDELYPAEIGSRLKENEHYMDYTGSSPYSNSQLEAAFQELRHNVFGNPHSENPSSKRTEDKIEDIRDLVRSFFNADPREYQVVFTKSATGSLKLVGETFPWSENSEFRYLRQNHNSVLGMREYALRNNATYRTVEESWVSDWLANKIEDPHQPSASPGSEKTYSLFSFPAEDNFAGVKYPLKWVERTKAKSTEHHEWKVMLDAAAYVPTQPLDLAKVPADFVAISFYKIFGYPTGLGALLVRTENVELLRKVFWGGGSVALSVPKDNFHVLKCKPTERLEDGTVAFLDIIALRHGFDMIEKLGGVSSIQAHVACLTEWLYSHLKDLKHSNGQPMVKIFGKHAAANARQVQGGIINFELLNEDGSVFSYRTFQRESAEAGFHIRTGCECNPGACYSYVGIEEADIESLAGTKEGCGDEVEWVQVVGTSKAKETMDKLTVAHDAEVALQWIRKPLGTIRVSLGYMSTFEDCYAFVKWVGATYKDRAVQPPPA